jgi:hypothetical protein
MARRASIAFHVVGSKSLDENHDVRDQPSSRDCSQVEWRRQVMSRPGRVLSTSGKILALYLHDETHHGRLHGRTGWQKVWYPLIAEGTGMSEDSVGRAIDQLVAVGALRKSQRRDEEGHTRVLLDLDYLDADPDTWEHEHDRQHGGLRGSTKIGPSTETVDLEDARAHRAEQDEEAGGSLPPRQLCIHTTAR